MAQVCIYGAVGALTLHFVHYSLNTDTEHYGNTFGADPVVSAYNMQKL